jgi:signal transduction histidine kinase
VSLTVAQQPARILIVDDERHNRTLLEVMLAPEGFVLTTAASGEEALAMVAQQPPDLIVLDVLMPGIGGHEVAAALKGSLSTKNIPIIMVTAHDDHDAKLFGLTAGAEDFLTKPLDRAELCMRVRNLLRLKVASDSALARRDESMGMVSHDLRDLLNGIVLNVTVLADMCSEFVPSERSEKVLKRISDYVARMDRLVGDLVDVVSLDAGKLALKLSSCDAVALLTETIESCAHAASEHGVSVRSETGDNALHAVLDRERILQVLGNLVTNALKFTPRGGSIALRCEHVTGELRLSVSDTGAGIPSDMLEAVFQRFRQVTKNDHRGLGLGLYICRCIVESHGGRMWVDSELGHGSTFHIAIPEAGPPRRSVYPDNHRWLDSV